MHVDPKTLLIAAAAALLVAPALGLPHASAQLPQTVTYCQTPLEVSGQSVPEEPLCVSAYVGPPESDPICGDACVPAGAVLAFDLVACPTGWTAYSAAAGRNVVGVGVGGSGLTARTLGQTGGAETHTLSVAQMPAHSHVERIPTTQGSTVVAASASDAPGGSRFSVQPSGGAQDAGDLTTGDTGGGQSFGVMDPFIALLYCRKS